MNLAIATALLVLFALLTLSSYVERVYAEIGKFLSREFQDNIDAFEQQVEPELRVSRTRAAVSMSVLTPLIMAAVAMVVGFGVFRDGAWTADEILEAVLGLILIVIVFNRFLPFIFFSRTKGEWLARWVQRVRPFSRVPVFEGNIDNIVGLVYAQDVLQVPDAEAHHRTVGSLMRKDVHFVPETKLGSDLLREMQKNKVRMAIVIDEYGGVAGLVTIEDLVEEIVGEITDEHEPAQVIRESETSYLVPGNMDVDRLEELLGVRPDTRGAATGAGLVSEVGGRIPKKGEVVEEDGLRLEVLQATDRRVERVRVSVVNSQQMKLI